jgi:hypothetical protein
MINENCQIIVLILGKDIFLVGLMEKILIKNMSQDVYCV